MDIKKANEYPSNSLSNFTGHNFTVDGVKCNSMEGFLQSLKFSGIEMQEHVCTLIGYNAKRTGKGKKWWVSQTLYWRGKPIKRDSKEYQDLLDKAYNELNKNEKFRKALAATGDSPITHSIGKKKINETVLTEHEFCSRLIKLRREINNEQ